MSGAAALNIARKVAGQASQLALPQGKPDLFNYPVSRIIQYIASISNLKDPPELRHAVRPANPELKSNTVTPELQFTTVNVPGQDQVLDPEAAETAGPAIEICAEGLVPTLMTIYNLATTKAIKAAAKEAVISQRQLEAV